MSPRTIWPLSSLDVPRIPAAAAGVPVGCSSSPVVTPFVSSTASRQPLVRDSLEELDHAERRHASATQSVVHNDEEDDLSQSGVHSDASRTLVGERVEASLTAELRASLASPLRPDRSAGWSGLGVR